MTLPIENQPAKLTATELRQLEAKDRVQKLLAASKSFSEKTRYPLTESEAERLVDNHKLRHLVDVYLVEMFREQEWQISLEYSYPYVPPIVDAEDDGFDYLQATDEDYQAHWVKQFQTHWKGEWRKSQAQGKVNTNLLRWALKIHNSWDEHALIKIEVKKLLPGYAPEALASFSPDW